MLYKGTILRCFCLFASTLVMTKGRAAVRFVDASNMTPAPPFVTWSGAATNIQDAVDAANPGDEVVVNDGIYGTGGRAFPGQLTNRVVVNKAIVVKSVNGASATSIVGHQVPGSTNGDSAARCVYIGSNAVLIGFTLSNGGTLTNGLALDSSGGGVWCEAGAWLKDCIISGNASFLSGGGAYSGNLTNCIIVSNRSDLGGGAILSTLHHCRVLTNIAVNGGGLADGTAHFTSFVGNSVVPPEDTFNVAVGSGGGVRLCVLDGCRLDYNSAHAGGGALGGRASNCVFMGNSAVFFGGGTLSTELHYCTIVANQALRWGSGGAHLGSETKAARNCIVYYNTAPSAPDLLGDMLYCCTSTLWGIAMGCITNEPAFVDVSG